MTDAPSFLTSCSARCSQLRGFCFALLLRPDRRDASPNRVRHPHRPDSRPNQSPVCVAYLHAPTTAPSSAPSAKPSLRPAPAPRSRPCIRPTSPPRSRRSHPPPQHHQMVPTAVLFFWAADLASPSVSPAAVVKPPGSADAEAGPTPTAASQSDTDDSGSGDDCRHVVTAPPSAAPATAPGGSPNANVDDERCQVATALDFLTTPRMRWTDGRGLSERSDDDGDSRVIAVSVACVAGVYFWASTRLKRSRWCGATVPVSGA